MEILIKAAVAGVAGSIMALVLRRNAPELSLALTVAVSVLTAVLAMELFSSLADIIKLAETETGLSPAVVAPVMKCVGIGVVTRLSADLCKDAGQESVSSAVELCGAACAMLTAMPLIRTLLQMIGDML
jgi:stage III sporulation protein AD